MSRAELEDYIRAAGESRFRAAQIADWLRRGVDFDGMSNLPAALRARLIETCTSGIPKIERKLVSQVDGTVKYLFRLDDGECVETVIMFYKHGTTACISSQVGCRMGCRFCASTIGGKVRDLRPSEMLGQLTAAARDLGERIDGVVMMGIGEPFDNYENMAGFLKLIHHPDGYNLSYRNITVSTCGVIPGIRKFMEDFPQVNLAISLHAPNEAIRRQSMPVTRKYGYDELMEVCREYAKVTGRRITFEYALIDGFNDSRENALELAGRLKGWQTHVNLIPLNKVEGTGYDTPNRESVQRFRRILEENHVAVTVRRTLGADIDAACGQLRLRYRSFIDY